jgi:hypothetical protein
MAWEHYEKNIYNKIIYSFEVIREVLQDLVILLENIYNINKIRVILYIFGIIQVLISKNDPRNYRGAGVKQTIVITIEIYKCKQ